MSNNYELWCYVQGDNTTFPVEASSNVSIGKLKVIIKGERSNFLQGFDASSLTLIKVDVNHDEVWDKVEAGEYQPGSNGKVLDENFRIFEEWPRPPPDGHLHIFVELPTHDCAASQPLPGTSPAETRDLWPGITINAAAQGDFGPGAVERNRIFQLFGTKPDDLMEFRTKIRQRLCIDSITNPMALLLKDDLSEFDNYFQEAPTGVGQRDRVSSKRLLWHLAGAFLSEGWKEGNFIKEENVRWIFDQLGWYFKSVLGLREKHAYGDDWPFKLIVSVEHPKKEYRCTPRSDFSVFIDKLACLLVEIQSEEDQSDRNRMLLQAACAARLGRQMYNNLFIVVALYIENSGMVTRYFIFQRDDANPTVFYDKDVQYWKQPSELFVAMFEIYNLVSIIQSDRPVLGSIQERKIGLLSSDIYKNIESTFMSKQTHGLWRGEHVYHDRQVVDAFTRAGYTLESNDEDENGWAPLIQLKPTMRHAIQSNGTAVVVKLLHPDTNELQFLRHFHQINSPDNHTIPLLATFKLNIGTFICVPKATPLDIGFALGKFRNNVVDFSRQLIEGVGFLHRHGIAHLDIKPENIVAFPHQLFIIDFDISVRVSDPNALIDRWCGTPGWMAPEIGRRNGPRCSYSPIRADLWSCGRVLQYLAREGAVKEENPFEALTWRLLSKVPQKRPLLPRHHPSQLTVGHSMSQLQHSLKRKADDLPHSAKRLAICTAQP